MTPTFMGSEPTFAAQGQYAGTRVFDDELAARLALINSLTDSQRNQAIVSGVKPSNNNRGELFQDNAVVPYQGVKLNTLNEQQKEFAIELIQLYTGQMRSGYDEIKLTEILSHWD
jgi:hypothetical protein